MTWTRETSCGRESDKIAALAVPYLQGHFLDLGAGTSPVWPSAICVDNRSTFGGNTIGIKGDIANLAMFADGSLDAVFSSHALEDFDVERVPTVLAEWARVIKVGGYLCLYVPSANLYPKMGEEGANPAHRWDIYPGDIERHLLAGTTCGWTQVEAEERGDYDEYSLWEVYQKRDDGDFVRDVWNPKPGGKPRALIVRYGAIGDMCMASSVFPMIKKAGFHLTVNTTPRGYEIARHDPHVDEWIIQATDFVPNEQLGPYWHHLARRYDLFINLCESIEGSLLALPGRREDMMHDIVRRNLMGTVNYLERTHDLAGMPHEFAPKFYPTEDELEDAWDRRSKMDGPVVYWAINGSSPHKVYAYPQLLLAMLMEKTDAHVVFTGDNFHSKQLQDGIIDRLKEDGYDLSRFHGWCGQQTVRESLTFAMVSDVVLGPETGVLNAVAMEPVPKIIYLSHSSPTNLTKHWKNTIVVRPDPDRAPCYPCHRLHYDWSRCHVHEDTGAALCAAAISPGLLLDVIQQVLDRVLKAKSAAQLAEVAD